MSYKVYNRFDLARMIVSYLDGVRYVSIDGASTVFSTGTLVIKPGNNITFSTFSNGFSIIGDTAGTANSTNYMMASERDNYFKTSANTFANSTHTHGSLALTNLSGTSNSNGLSLSAPNIGIAGNIISAGSQSANASGTVVFFNSNGVSFGMSGNSMITASIDNLNSQAVVSLNGSSGTLSLSATDNISIQNTSNTIVIGGPASVIKALSIGGTDSSNVIYNEGVYIEAGNNVTLSKSDNSITIGADFSTTLQNVVYPAVSDTTFQTGIVLVQGLNNITVTYNSNTINIVGPDVPQQQTGISGIAGSAASTVTDGTVVFANANGISFGLYSNTMTASHDAITSQSIQTQNVHNLIIDGNTTGTTSEISSGTLYLVAGSNITLSQDNNTITIIGQSGGTVTGTAAADGINALVVNSGASTSATTLTLSNSNNVSFGINNGIITASASFSSTQLNQVVSAPNGTYSFETLKLVNSNGVSWLTGTGGIIASVNTGYITLNSSSVFMNTSERGNYFYTSVSSNLYFADSNGVTFGSSTSGDSTTITASVSLGTGGGGAGVGSFVILGNTTNNTTASGSTIALSAANNITIGASNNSIIRFIGPEASLYFVNSNNISFGTSTSGISTTVTLSVLGGATANFELSGNTSGNSTVNGSLIRLIAGNGVTFSGTNTSQLRIDAATDYVKTASSSLFQHTSNTSAITSNAVNTSQSSLFQLTSATSAITSNALNTNQSSLFQLTSATSNITTNAAYSTHTHGIPTLYLTNLSGTTNSASNGLSISLSAQTVGGGGGAVIAAGTQTGNTSGTVIFSNSNSFTFGMSNNSIITASFSESTHAHPYIETSQSSLFQLTSATSAITSRALNTSQSSLFQHTSATSAITTNAAYSTHTHGNVSLYLTNLSGTTNSASNGLSISLSAATGAGGGDGLVVIAAGTQTGNTTGTVVFSNSNSFTFGMSNNSVVTASFSQSTHDHPYVNTSQSSLFQQTSATSAITSNALNTNQSSLFQHTSATSNITSNAINTSQSTLFQHTSATSAITTGAVGRIWLSGNYAGDSTLSGNTIRIYGGNNVTVSGTNTTAFYIHGRAGSIYFNDSNGVTFGASVSSESTTITASHDAVRLFVLSGNTSGQSTASGNSIRLVGGNNITVSAGTGTNSSIIQINGGAGAGADGYNSVQFTNSTANSTMPIVWAGNSNGSGNITLGLTGSTVTGSAPSGGVGSYNILAAGTQTANTTGTVVFSNSNGLSFGMSNNSVITASHEERSLYFSNANGVTFGTSTNGSSTTVSASVNVGGAANTVTIYAGQDSTTFTDNFRLLNDATLTASQYVAFYTTISTATNGNTFGIAARVPKAIALSSSTRFAGTGTSATNASITLDSNGLAISVANPGGDGGYTLTGYDPFNFGMGGLNTATSVTSFSTNRTVVNAVQIPFPVVFNKLQLLESFSVSVSNATAATTLANSFNLTNNFTLFERYDNPGNTASTLFSSVTSGSAALTFSYNFVGATQTYGIAYYKDSTGGVNVYSTSNTTTISNGSSIFTGIKLVEIPIPDVTLTAGEYFLALKQSTSGNSFSVSNVIVNLQGNTLRLLINPASSTAQLHFGGGYDFAGNGYATTISNGEAISKVTADGRKMYYRLGYGNVY